MMYTLEKKELDKLLTFKTQNNAFVREVEKLNAEQLEKAVDGFVNGGAFKWKDYAFDTFEYKVIEVEKGKTISGIESIDISTKVLKMSDVFCLKANKNSNKIALAKDLATLLDCMCGNLAKNYMVKAESVSDVKIWKDFDKSLECFVSDEKSGRDSSSKVQLENQVNRLFEVFFGKDTVKARKSDVTMLVMSMTQARLKKDKSGFITGGEIALLEKLMVLAYEISKNRVYNHTLKSASGKAPKKDK